jgi:hypothetical protein
MALAAGVNGAVSHEHVNFSQAGMMSPDGRYQAFDASANGYVRGEGAGIVVLKPLSRAEADGDRIYALIRGSAVNQDGHTSGLTVPSQAAQERVTREACLRAGVLPGEIDYVEAHGTGTPVGIDRDWPGKNTHWQSWEALRAKVLQDQHRARITPDCRNDQGGRRSSPENRQVCIFCAQS